MTKKILILTLKDCSYCANFRQLLDAGNIPYSEIDCYDKAYCDQCDEYESLSGSRTYPMTIYNDELIICLTSDYNNLGKIIDKGKYNVLYCHSINNMFDIINKLLLL